MIDALPTPLDPAIACVICRGADIKRQLEQAEEQIATEPLLDLDKAANLLQNLGSLIDRATLDERRALIQIVFSSFWIMETQIHAVQPQVAYGVLLEEMRRLFSLERETGVDASVATLPRWKSIPLWVTYNTPFAIINLPGSDAQFSSQ